MRFARIVFLVAGIYGLIALLPLYFMEEQTGRDYLPPITHPEYYYGFIGIAVAWQLVFLVLSRDPVRYRPLMLPAIVEKVSFGIPVAILYLLQRVSGFILGAAMIDSFLGVLFLIAYLRTPGARQNVG
jgi:hypothetical protein